MKLHAQSLALGGVVGPVAFVGSWALAGATTPGYSPIDRAISDLAAVNASTRVAMTLGFLGFGIGIAAFGLALHEALDGPAWIAALATGGSAIGVGATPLGGWSGDGVHAALASIGYAAIVALPLLAATRIGRRDWARASRMTAVLSGACLLASTVGPAHGLWQRLGLTLGDAWIAVTAWHLVAASRRVTSGRRR